MCLFVLLGFAGFAAYVCVVIFFETARLLLPWTISATVLSCLVVCFLNETRRPEFKPQWPVYGFANFVLTIVFGYLGFWLLPPYFPPPEPPPEPAKKGLERIVSELLEPPKLKMEMNRDAMFAMLPVHLAITGCIGAIIVEGIVERRNSRSEMQDPDKQ